ncbi:site-specific integrase [Mycolicibacterium baixiangningiae]|uniref:hypothetical protein n=1 Tax=Mycolicibacterium baixiangningiae TaxID=2761578 RepID=UPI001867AD8D|nr:hypothetical protein [Mycolicibacterium baixiangningiae]
MASLVDRVSVEANGFRALTMAEVFAVLDHDCRDRHLWAMAQHGMRRGEIGGSKWSSVNLTDKQIRRAQVAAPDAVGARRGEPRGAIARRRCPTTA